MPLIQLLWWFKWFGMVRRCGLDGGVPLGKTLRFHCSYYEQCTFGLLPRTHSIRTIIRLQIQMVTDILVENEDKLHE